MNGLKFIRSHIINMTMDELAEMLNVSKQAIYTWESGRKNIPDLRLEQLSKLSGIPKVYFGIFELTERDKIEIKHYKLRKDVEDNSFDYDDSLYVDELLMKIKTTIYEPSEEKHLYHANRMNERSLMINKFVDILTGNEQTVLLLDVLNAMELFFDEKTKNNMLGEGLSTDRLQSEHPLVQDIYGILQKHNKEQIQARIDDKNNYLNSLKEKYDK